MRNGSKKLDEQEESSQQADDYPPLLDGLAPIVRSGAALVGCFRGGRKLMPHVRELIDVRDRPMICVARQSYCTKIPKTRWVVAIVRRADEQTRVAHQMMVASHRLNMLVFSLFFPIATLGLSLGRL